MTNPSRPSDRLYATPLHEIVDFTFDACVAHVFADMINRSVPGYATLISMIGLLAAQYAQAHTQVYDLGCSLGACSFSMQQALHDTPCRIIAVDNAPAMIEKLRDNLTPQTRPPIQPLCANLLETRIHDASVVVLNFTLQFIALEQRRDLLRRIYAGLHPGGLLILSEKSIHTDPHIQSNLQTLHHQYKKTNGYSALEIAQKRIALEQTLHPETHATHLARLQDLGFTQCSQWFQCLNFLSIMAIK